MAFPRFHMTLYGAAPLLCALSLGTAGCYPEIAYDPQVDPAAADSATPADSSSAADGSSPSAAAPAEAIETPAPTTEPPSSERRVERDVDMPVTPVADAQPQDRYAMADAASGEPSPAAPPEVEPELFPTEESSSAVPDRATSSPPVRSESADTTLLPWEASQPSQTAEQAATSSEAASGETQGVAMAQAEEGAPDRSGPSLEGVFPWDDPAEPDGAATPIEPEESSAPVAPSLEPQEEAPPPPVDEVPLLPPATIPLETTPLATPPTDPTPAVIRPATSQHAAWLLGSKLSYALLAPAEEGSRVEGDVAPLASLLGVEMATLDYQQLRGTPEGMSRMLAVGRELGEQLATRHDPAHAALVEIAMKSNLLLAVYAERPHLAHSIGGSVAAAAVRAGIPEEIWQPWQDAVAAGGSTDDIAQAVLDLHHQIDIFLQNPPRETADAILR